MNINLKFLAQVMLLLPFAILGLMAVFAFFLRKHTQLREHILGGLTVGTSFALLILSVLMLYIPEKECGFFYMLPLIGRIDFRLDALSIFMILLINTVAFAASWNALDYLARTPQTGKLWWQKGWAFHILIHFFHFTMLLVPLADNLVVAWIAIELTTVGSAFLIVYEDKPNAWEATWKYLVVTSAGIVLALLGTIFLANSLPQLTIEQSNSNILLNWSFLMKQNDLNKQFVWFAFLFALAGYGTKAGLAPLHSWLPDGHGEAPSPVSALLSGVLLKASLYVILRFFILTNTVLGETYKSWTFTTLLIAGLFSLIVSTPLILRSHTPFKRVLAYHSLEHMGIITFGLGMGGFVSVAGAILHMFNHAITKALMFLAYGNLAKRYENAGIAIKGALRTMPWSGGLLTLSGLVLVGTPPFNIFMSEWLILWGSLARFFSDAGDYPSHAKFLYGAATVLFVLSTTLIFYGLVNHLRKIVLDKPDREIPRERFRLSAVVPLLFLFFPMFLLGIWIIPPIAQLVNEITNIILPLSQ